MTTKIRWDDADELRTLLVGRTITAVEGDRLILDDGRQLTVVPNTGCGGCDSGWYDLDELTACDNLITGIEVSVTDGADGDGPDTAARTTFRLFVIADNRQINVATVSGTDGNGYYGTGFWLEVTGS